MSGGRGEDKTRVQVSEREEYGNWREGRAKRSMRVTRDKCAASELKNNPHRARGGTAKGEEESERGRKNTVTEGKKKATARGV